jgi:hypothetical protein
VYSRRLSEADIIWSFPHPDVVIVNLYLLRRNYNDEYYRIQRVEGEPLLLCGRTLAVGRPFLTCFSLQSIGLL